MLNSGILDFAVGLVFLFLAMSLAAGAATEAVSSFLKLRSLTLFEGVKDLLNDPKLKGLAAELYQHGLINPRHDGTAPTLWNIWRKGPAYIDPDQFAAAFLDILKGLPSNAAVPPQPSDANNPPPPPPADPALALKQAVNAKLPLPSGTAQAKAEPQKQANGQLRNMLHGIIDRAEGDEEKVRKELSSWFDNAMDRVSGVYKRYTQLFTFIFAFLMAAILNVSAINVAETLWRQPVATKAMESFKNDNDAVNNALKTLNQLPVGWPPNYAPPTSDIPPKKPADATKPDASTAAPPKAADASTPPAKPADAVPGTAASKKADSDDQFLSLFQFLNRSPCNWNWTRIFGWVITAFATLFGAPFWFDALQQIVRLKGSGPSPADKKQPDQTAGVAAAAAAGAAAATAQK